MRSLYRLATLTVFILVVGALPRAAMSADSAVPGYPDSIDAYDPREVALLPPYCKHTPLFRANVPGANDPEKVQYWRSVMGRTVTGKPPNLFETMHHYCWGLMKTNRAVRLARTKQARMYYLNSSIGEFDYVLRHAPPTFALLPEILTRKGENLLRLGKIVNGISELERAIEIKPDYWPPYLAIGNHFAANGDTEAARKALERGLAAAPDAKALQVRLDALAAGKSHQ